MITLNKNPKQGKTQITPDLLNFLHLYWFKNVF